MSRYLEIVPQITPGSVWVGDTDTIEVIKFDAPYAVARSLTGPTVGTRYETGIVNWQHFGTRYQRVS